MVRCEICGWEGNDELEEHLLTNHFIGYNHYYEKIVNGYPLSENCWKCGYPRRLLSSWLNIYLPCMACMSSLSNASCDERRRGFIDSLQDYQRKIARTKSLQYLLSDDSSLLACYPPDLLRAGDLLKQRQHRDRIKVGKGSYLQVSSIPGTMFEISEESYSNLVLSSVEEASYEDDLENKRVKINYHGKTTYIYPPELIPYDDKHHSRHSILNPGSKRNSKRIRIGKSGDCYKFYGPQTTIIKSIFLVEGKAPLHIIKQTILGSKMLRDPFYDIYNEIINASEFLYDKVLVKNSTVIFGTKSLNFYLAWTQDELPVEVVPGGSNIKLTMI